MSALTRIKYITLFERHDGERTMKFGRHEGREYLDDENEIRTEEAEVVELEESKRPYELQNAEDFPERVREFFGHEE